jgi:hypothetical protein
LRNAVAIVTDTAFTLALTSGVTPMVSTGVTAEAVRADIANMLRAISTGQASKLFLLVTPLICKSWSMATDQKSVSAFPDLGPMGGSINGIIVIANDGVPSGTAILVDASGVAAAPGEVTLAQYGEGLVISDSAPDSPPTGSTTITSLWQNNQVAIVVERWFCAVRLRTDAVASVFSSTSYQGGNSPP